MRISIGICTFRRPQVVDAIRAVLAQARPMGIELELIVADNDETDAAKTMIEAAAENAPFPFVYIHAPQKNISIARNAVLDAAQGDWVAFLDDDETVAPSWIGRLAGQARTAGADVVFGPVEARYPAGAPDWIVRGDFHSTRLTADPSRTGQGHSGNVLIRTKGTGWSGLRFDPDLGRSGGEDTAFFEALRAHGARFAYEPEATAREDASPDRLNFDWLWRRRIRYGQTHARLRLQKGASALVESGGASLKALLCFVCAAAAAPFPLARRRWLLRGALHWGALGRYAGGKDLELY